MPKHSLLLLLTSLLTVRTLAVPGFFDEAPLLPPQSLNPVTVLANRQYLEYSDNSWRTTGGIALTTDSSGNILFATGPSMSKYSSAGELIWSRTHANVVQTVTVDGQSQSRYYETWDNQESALIPQGSNIDRGEQVDPYAERVVADSQGNVYGNFIDTKHPDRSLVVKFSPDGAVIWRHITDLPYTTDSGFPWRSRVLSMVLLPDESGVALLEVLRTGGATNFRTRLVIFQAETSRADRNGEWRTKLLYGLPRENETESHHAIGIGLAVGLDGALYFANLAGDEKAPEASEYPQVNVITLRRMPSPYTAVDRAEVVAFVEPTETWNDLAIGPDGHIYLAGTSFPEEGRFQMGASFDPATFDRLWRTIIPNNGTGYEPANGTRLFVDSQGVNIVGASTLYPNTAGATQLSVSRLDLNGNLQWHKFQTSCYFGGAFGDPAGNVYLIGSNYYSSNFAFTFWKYSAAGHLQVISEFGAPAGRRYDWTSAKGVVAPGGKLLISMPDLNSEFNSGDRIVHAQLLSLTNPAVVAPPTGDSPPAVRITDVNVQPQGGRFPFKFVVHLEVLDDRGVDRFYYLAKVDGKSSGWVRFPIPHDGKLPFDVDCYFFSVSLRAIDTSGQKSATASFVADRVGNTSEFVISKKNPPLPPQSFAANTTSGNVVLTWDDISNETEFLLQRSKKGRRGFSPAKTIAHLPADSETFTDAEAASGKTYRYILRSVSSGGKSGKATVEVIAP